MIMFCPLCGNKLVESHKFCCKCGNPAPPDVAGSLQDVSKVQSSVYSGEKSGNDTTASIATTPSFEKFQMTKRKERASNFRPTGKKSKRKKDVDEDITGEVKINVGIMLFDGNELKPQRSKTLPMKVQKGSSKNDILNIALVKHKAHFHSLIKDSVEYVLLYPDGSIIDKLKESDDNFILYKYKAEYGKPYHRINLFICPSRDHIECSVNSLAKCLVESSESDVESVNVDDESISICPEEQSVRSPTTATSTIANSPTSSSQNLVSNPTVTVPECTLGNSSSTTTTLVSRAATTTLDDVTIAIPSYVHVDLLSTSINSSRAQNAPSDGVESAYESLTEMFPQLSPAEARDALLTTNNNFEAAVNRIISSQSQSTTHEEVYAAFDFCNNIENDPEFLENLNDNPVNDATVLHNDKNESRSDENESLHELIGNLATKKLKAESSLRIKVRRSHVWEDVKVKMNRCSEEDLQQVIRVQFVGEPAVDQGGPKRELFSLLHKYMNESSSMFTGEKNNKCFSNNVVALEQHDYLKYGRLCAMAIIQGSPSPSFFAPPVVDYILHGEMEKVHTSVADVPSAKVRNKVMELQNTTDSEDFKQLASFNCSMRFKAGYTKPIVTIEDKASLIHYICLHYTVLHSLPHVEQFIEGLKLFGLLELVRQSPEKARMVFQICAQNQLTAETVDEMFHVEFSPEGSNKRPQEEAIAFHFTRYLEDIDAGEVKGNLWNFTSESATEVVFSLGDMLQFVTGSVSIPAVGYDPQPSIVFNHYDVQRKLQANTCANRLLLPVNDLLLDYESFKTEITSCILMSPGFGTV